MGIAGFALAAAIIAVFCLGMKGYRPEFGVLVSLAASIALFIAVLPSILSLISGIGSLASGLEGLSAYLSPVIRALGISVVTGIAADTCRDAGESSLANRVELLGRVLVLVIALDLAGDLLLVVEELLG